MQPSFGISVVPETARWREATELVVLADRIGLDLVGIQDHPYQWRFLDTWTLISVLAARTDRIRFFPDVANLPLRPPAMLATSVASLDVLTGGRVELGLGSGGFDRAVEAMGGTAWSGGEAVAALSEAIDVIRRMWTGERGARYAGRYFRLAGVNPGPVPEHDVGIWLGVNGPRMLQLLGEKADGWVPSSGHVPPSALPERQRRIDDAAAAAGRDPHAIARVYNVGGAIADERSDDPFIGPVSRWVDTLTQLTLDMGMTAYVLWPGGDAVRQVEIFANEVAPAVRAAVASA
jgi:alkanesulfonate monooxygenase SsuD/methylene tetrahydromethanopterin reductase-like flavin-dependent oxidoreductase (luciferase family)